MSQAYMVHDELALYCKDREIGALRQSKNATSEKWRWYWGGKAAAAAEIWEKVVFGTKTSSAEEYNKANEQWSSKVAKSHEEGIPKGKMCDTVFEAPYATRELL